MDRTVLVDEEMKKSKSTDDDEKIGKMDLDNNHNCFVMMKLPIKLRDRLLPFQKEGVRFAVRKNGRCLIADEMGLGKTIQAISVAYIYKDEWPLLIIVPSSLKFCWIEELEKWLPDILPHEINLVQSGSDVSGMAVCPITIVTYGLLRLPSSKVIREALNTRKFQVVICDESHYLKNINTSSCKTVIPILKMANRRLLLSGTPALAKPVELYPQIDAICPGKFGSFWQYTDKYCDAHNVYFGKFRKRQVDGASNLEELQQKLKSMLMIRREKSDVLTELPPKQRQKIMFELKNSPLKKEIFETFAELKQKMQKGDGTVQKVMHSEDLNLDIGLSLPDVEFPSRDKTFSGVYSLISRLYKLSGEAKIGPVREYIEMLCEDEQLKFLVFAYHHDMMDGIQQTLWERKVKFVRIDGNTRSTDRQMSVNQFQSDPETRVAILSILAAGVGLTLTAAKLVVFSELYWTPGVMVQCEDRAHRIGQTSSLPVHYLVARDTMDEWVWSAVCRKTLVTSTALTGRTRHLDHGEGSSHQIELLSNADMWKLEDGNTDVDVADLVQSQRASDQSSILEFFKSQRSPDCTPSHKRKHHMIPPEAKSSVSDKNAFSSLDKPPCQDFRKEMPDLKKNKIMKDFHIIVVSDDENDFRPAKKSRKTEHRKTKKRKHTVKNKPLEKNEKCDHLGLTDFEGSPTFDLNFCEDSENSLTKVDYGESSLLNEMSFNADKLKSLENGLCLDKPLKDESNVECLCSSDVREMRTELDPVKDADTSHKQVVSCNSERCLSSQSSIDHLQNSCNVFCEAPQSHPCFSNIKEKQTIETISDQWSCSICTFFNHPELPHCEQCDTPKKKSTFNLQQDIPQELPHTEHDSQRKLPQIRNSHHAKDFSPLTKSSRKKHCSQKIKQTTCSKFTILKAASQHQTIVSSSDIVNFPTKMDLLSQCPYTSQPRILFPSPGTDPASENDCQSQKMFPADSLNQTHVSIFDTSVRAQLHVVEYSESELEKLTSTTFCGSSLDILPAQNSAVLPSASVMISTQSSEESCSATDNMSTTSANCTDLSHQAATQQNVVPSNKLSHSDLKFSCSIHTGRIYVYDENEQFLQASFHPVDIEMGNTDELPEILHQPQLQKFVREWSSLTDTKKRLIAKRCQVFASPLSAYEAIKTVHGSKQRHLSKQDTLTSALKSIARIQGSIQVISKHATPTHLDTKCVDQSSTSVRGMAQAVTENGVPLCLLCQRPYSNPLLPHQTISDPENAWQLRLCSFSCMDQYWTLSRAGYCRDQVYDLQRGVCQMCSFDAHSLFSQIRVTKSLKVRADLIRDSPYRSLISTQREKMVEHPQPGQFWHVDHITPVWQGGGLCDLDNLRTLCTPCHFKVTRRQAGQRATMKKLSGAAGQADITAFFQRS